ncbi:recombinase RecT [Falsiroseomonas tokyonensis]|uniref:Recombinase RecT n=1 Tax=Falsiroseomonas tokyonensis TaxID=430521 RepID=A0ABV7C284_9PROT|nr:recombinase RecT [Falsiroseomonas tokyonensis]MBU8540226.1 recombinase RecT [Falsiroseomonas tokyonensis]
MSETRTKPRPTMAPPSAATAVMSPEEMRTVLKQTGREAGGSKVSSFFEANKGKLAQLLPEAMKPDRFLRITLNALRTTPKLMECTIESLFGASIFCAQLGLEPNTPQGHIYLIPFKNNRKNITEVQVIIGYQGLIALARRTGEIQSISAQAVFANDDFDIDWMSPENSRHKPPKHGTPRGEFIGAWAKATFKDGGFAFDYMPAEDILKIRDGSQGYRSAVRFAKPGQTPNTPWATNFDQMAVKTAIRRLAKRLPMSIEFAAAATLDEAGDRRVSQGMHRVLDHGEFDLSAIGQPEDDEDADAEPPPRVQEPEPDQRQPRQGRQPRQPRGQQQEADAPSAETPHDLETGEVEDGDGFPGDGDTGGDPGPQTDDGRSGGPPPRVEFGE